MTLLPAANNEEDAQQQGNNHDENNLVDLVGSLSIQQQQQALLVTMPQAPNPTTKIPSTQQPAPPVTIRRGAKYIVEGKVICPDSIASPQQLQDSAHQLARQQPGSKKYDAAWKHWCMQSIDAIRYNLQLHLPDPADAETFGALFYNLGTAADRGDMPSFANAGARSGYAMEFFCRARLLADVLLDKYTRTLLQQQQQQQQLEESLEAASDGSRREDIYINKFCAEQCKAIENIDDDNTRHKNEHEEEERVMRIISLGGGPAYDFVGILLADTFGTCGYGKTRITGTVYDYEEGWGSLVDAMNTAAQLAFVNTNQSTIQWGGICDITKSLTTHPSNAACRAELPTADVVVCQYCVAENANPLRASDFVFFTDLFEQAVDETVIIISEVTSRLWPEIIDLLLLKRNFNKGNGNGSNDGNDNTTTTPCSDDYVHGFDIEFARAKKQRKLSPQLIIQKRKGARIRQEDLDALQVFRRLKELHDRKMSNGYTRQAKYVKGVK